MATDCFSNFITLLICLCQGHETNQPRPSPRIIVQADANYSTLFQVPTDILLEAVNEAATLGYRRMVENVSVSLVTKRDPYSIHV